MIRLTTIKIPLDIGAAQWPGIAAALLRIQPSELLACRLVRQSIDARRKDDVHFVVTLDVDVRGDAAAIVRRSRCKQAAIAPKPASPLRPAVLELPPARRPIVVGSGPAGLFAALTLARAGAMPLVLERGRDAVTRRADVEAFWQSGALNPSSNVQFGEGGAGTFSDGKLTTGIKNPRCGEVLRTFVASGAPESLLHQAMPHMGTDYLVEVVQRMRREIEALGGEVRFGAQLTGLHIENGSIRGVTVGDAQLECDLLALCIGHSARDTFVMLRDAGVAMEGKPFSIGARIEHPQAMINRAQYGRFAAHPALGAAPYKLAAHLPDGRGVYTFCMCPGGRVVAAASEAGGVVTNGMSYFARDGEYANAALLVDVWPEDLDAADPLAGMRFQQRWERLAFEAGGGGYRAPAQRVEDFLARRASASLGTLAATYRPGVTPADLRTCLPDFATDAMAESIRRFDRQLVGFAMPDAILTGVETRSSCPLRMPRGQDGQANIRGLFPAGEGAGYAGGIMSAAVDGIRAAELMLTYLQEENR